MSNILVVAAHPDDEILGCGATIAKLSQDKSNNIRTLIVAEGSTSRGNVRDINLHEQQLLKLKEEARKANETIGVTDLHFASLPDNRMDSMDLLDVVKIIEHHIEDFKPDIIFTHFVHDVNIDHNYVSRAVTTAARALPNSCVKEILFFEIASSTEWQMPYLFSPNVIYDVSNYFDKKIESLKHYASEMRAFPHARSYENVEAMARFRGASNGFEYAEAFVCGRILR